MRGSRGECLLPPSHPNLVVGQLGNPQYATLTISAAYANCNSVSPPEISPLYSLSRDILILDSGQRARYDPLPLNLLRANILPIFVLVRRVVYVWKLLPLASKIWSYPWNSLWLQVEERLTWTLFSCTLKGKDAFSRYGSLLLFTSSSFFPSNLKISWYKELTSVIQGVYQELSFLISWTLLARKKDVVQRWKNSLNSRLSLWVSLSKCI